MSRLDSDAAGYARWAFAGSGKGVKASKPLAAFENNFKV